MTSLEIKKDGSVYIQPDNIMVENQMEGHHIVGKHHPMTAINSTILCNPGIYPIPDLKYEVPDYSECMSDECILAHKCTSTSGLHGKGCGVKKVAVISLPLESTPSTEQIIDDINGLVIYQGDEDYPSTEQESQENLLQEIFDLCQQDEWHRILSKFTITRRK